MSRETISRENNSFSIIFIKNVIKNSFYHSNPIYICTIKEVKSLQDHPIRALIIMFQLNEFLYYFFSVEIVTVSKTKFINNTNNSSGHK